MTHRTRFARSIYFGLGVSSALAVLAALEGDARARAAYLRSEVGGQPWGQDANEQAMDLAFGAGNWDDLRFESVDGSLLFSPSYHVIYLEGSDGGAEELVAFLSSYQYSLEQWVNAGGTVLLNSGPNEGVDQVWGFGGIGLTAYQYGSNGTAVNAAHPIWNGPNLPAATVFSGGSYSHGTISGAVSAIIDDVDNVQPPLGELGWGSGWAMFGGLTTSNFWSPQPDALNLRANMLVYLARGGGADRDGDGLVAGADNCPLVANAGQEDLDGDGTGDLCETRPAAYVRSAEYAPWSSTSNEWAMNAVFGPDAWSDLRYETVDADALFSASYGFVYLEGSDNAALELDAFLEVNQLAIEEWVDGGGRLLLNAAPNEGASMVWGFGGVALTYPFGGGSSASAANAAHPVWNGPASPVSTAFTGGGYAHASVSGGGLTSIITDDSGDFTLGELAWGDGLVVFGGMTTDNFWSPQPDCHNLRINVIYYAAGAGVVDADGDGIADDLDNCPDDANSGQEDGDGDGVGDACDVCANDPSDDADGDGVCGDVDNCFDDANPEQEDADRDDVGDACDVCPNDAEDDADGDELCADVDNCPDDANPEQEDADEDGVGDVCETAGTDTSGGETAEGGTMADETGDDATATMSATDATATGLTGADGTGEGTDSADTTVGQRGDEDGGCACDARERGGEAWWLGLGVLGLLRRRRR